jgi:DNA-binding MarR family transcriptional regulator
MKLQRKRVSSEKTDTKKTDKPTPDTRQLTSILLLKVLEKGTILSSEIGERGYEIARRLVEKGFLKRDPEKRSRGNKAIKYSLTPEGIKVAKELKKEAE